MACSRKSILTMALIWLFFLALTSLLLAFGCEYLYACFFLLARRSVAQISGKG